MAGYRACMSQKLRPVPSDYDAKPQRFRLALDVLQRYGSIPDDVHPEVATRFAEESLRPVLDLGCGDGRLLRLLNKAGRVGLDPSATMLAQAPKPVVRGDGIRLPFRNAAFGAVAALYVLDHLDDPSSAIAEAHRVLKQGGLLATAAPSRFDSPELAHLFPPDPSPFDAEVAPTLLRRYFPNVEVVTWDEPLIHLPDGDAVRDYLIGRQVSLNIARDAAQQTEVPLHVTKRGAICFARKSLAP
jgi:SAM-dependent methyltransferase